MAPGASSWTRQRRPAETVGIDDGTGNNGIPLTHAPYMIFPDPPSGAPMINSRAFSFDARPYEVSGFSSGYGGNLIQQQLFNTQQMCLQQQNAMTTLTEMVNKLKQSIKNRDKQEREKRKNNADVSSEFLNLIGDGSSDLNVHSDNSDGELSSRDDNSSDDESVPVAKRQKTDSTETSKETAKESGTGTSNKKLEKLKNLESNFKKEKQYAEKVHEVVASTVNEGIEAVVEHKSDSVQALLKKYERKL